MSRRGLAALTVNNKRKVRRPHPSTPPRLQRWLEKCWPKLPSYDLFCCCCSFVIVCNDLPKRFQTWGRETLDAIKCPPPPHPLHTHTHSPLSFSKRFPLAPVRRCLSRTPRPHLPRLDKILASGRGWGGGGGAASPSPSSTPGSLSRRLWLIASSSPSGASLFISTECCSKRIGFIFRSVAAAPYQQWKHQRGEARRGPVYFLCRFD